MVATEAAEGIKESDRGAPGLGWDSRGVILPFICLFQNMATMKDTGKTLSLCSPPFRLTRECVASEM